MARDISERKQAESALHAREAELARFKSMLDETLDCMFMFRPGDLRFTYANQGATAQVGYCIDELLGMSPLDLKPELSEAEFRARLEALQQNRGESVVFETVHRHRGGHTIPVEVFIQYLDSSGDQPQFVNIVRDITARKRAEAEMRRARDEAQRANAAKDVFLATMSHEMRTPLNGLLGMLELVQLSGLEHDQAAALGIALDSGRHLVRLIDDVLDQAKIDAGRLDIQVEPVSLTELLARVVNTFHAVASAKNLTLSRSVDPRISPSLLADPLRVLQVVGNFVSNAVKFTPRGSVEMRAELVGRRNGIEVVRIAVRDTGIGISAEAQQGLFQPFAQAGPETSSLYGGTGLGLAISRRLAEMMGGSVEMESEPDQGTTLTLTLPLAVSDAMPAGLGAQQAQPAAVPRLRGAVVAPGATVLAVDDNPINRLLIRRQLETLGVPVQTAAEGREALELWRSGRFSLVITDCNMPELDGYALCREIRAVEAAEGRARTPVIGWTANLLRDAAGQCAAAGMDDMLAKPSELSMLRKLIEKRLAPHSTPEAERSDRANAAEPAGDEEAGPIDDKVLHEVTGGDTEMSVELLREFRAAHSVQVNRLHEVLAGADTSAIAQASHRLKGAARTVGAGELASVCEHIEAAANAKDLHKAQELRAALGRASRRTVESIDKVA